MSGQRVVDVVVGLISDGAGHWLVNCRPAGTPLAGSWEFPGGKLNTGEAPFAALKRELDEELGIDVLEARPLLTLTHDYPDKRVRLDVWHVLRYRGNASAREGQPLKWVTVEECRALELLEADWPIVAKLPLLEGGASHGG
ncbi:MAG TPA: (deoxy)nucleoside triphosphate pyrophosphohydrolase [Gammaproteobacteria bacterium]|nr:(deoxy)nucleoside triphosphate pyrophosphohydrolase [Gammaproteobacteria bacterium]